MKQAIYVFLMVFCVLFMGCGSDNGVSSSAEPSKKVETCVYTFTTEPVISTDRPDLSEAVAKYLDRAIGLEPSVYGWTMRDYLDRFYPIDTTTETHTVTGLLTEAQIAEYEGNRYVQTHADSLVRYLYISMTKSEKSAVVDSCYSMFQLYIQSREELAARYRGWVGDKEKDLAELERLFSNPKAEQFIGARLSSVVCKEDKFVTEDNYEVYCSGCNDRCYTYYYLTDDNGNEQTLVEEPNGTGWTQEKVGKYIAANPQYRVKRTETKCK